MAELKTRETKASVTKFLAGVEDPQKRADCRSIARMMREVTGKRPKMWGDSIVGYGRYDYTYKSGHSGTWMLTGFSPRARNITIYIMPGFSKFEALMKNLGKYKTARSCLYIKRLEDIDESVLARLVADSVAEMKRIYGTGK
jgi:hypothetical protein